MGTADAGRLTGQRRAGLGEGSPFAAAVRSTRRPMIIADPRLDDAPVVLVGDAPYALPSHGLIGCACFLQRADTDPAALARPRRAIADRSDVDVDPLNRRKDGTPFWQRPPRRPRRRGGRGVALPPRSTPPSDARR